MVVENSISLKFCVYQGSSECCATVVNNRIIVNIDVLWIATSFHHGRKHERVIQTIYLFCSFVCKNKITECLEFLKGSLSSLNIVSLNASKVEINSMFVPNEREINQTRMQELIHENWHNVEKKSDFLHRALQDNCEDSWWCFQKSTRLHERHALVNLNSGVRPFQLWKRENFQLGTY